MIKETQVIGVTSLKRKKGNRISFLRVARVAKEVVLIMKTNRCKNL